jgi:hypothetical protein
MKQIEETISPGHPETARKTMAGKTMAGNASESDVDSFFKDSG